MALRETCRLSLLVAVAACGRVPSHVIRLDEVRAVELPDGYRVSGGAAAESGAIVMWSSLDARLLFADRLGITQKVSIGRSRIPVGAAFVSGDSIIEVVDAFERALVRSNVRTGAIIVSALPLQGRIVSAHRTRDGWTVAVRDSSGNASLYVAISSAARPRAAPPRSSVGLRGISLGGTDSQTLATFVNPPFEVGRVRGDGTVSFFPAAMVSAIAVTRDTTTRESDLWVALPVVAVGVGWLQTLADLRSDARVLLLRDHTGTVLRQQRIEAPIGFFASVPQQDLVFAIRTGPRPQAVVYRYRWMAG